MRFILISTPVAPTFLLPLLFLLFPVSSQHAAFVVSSPPSRRFRRSTKEKELKGLLVGSLLFSLPPRLYRFYREEIKRYDFDQLNRYIVATRYLHNSVRELGYVGIRGERRYEGNYPPVSRIVGGRFASPRVVNNNSFSLWEST